MRILYPVKISITSFGPRHKRSKTTTTPRPKPRHNQTPPLPAPPRHRLLLPPLPNELSLEILSRLPVRTLITLTAVSKSWNFLINSPAFVKAHIAVSVSNPSYAHHHLLHTAAHSRHNLYRNALRPVLAHSLMAIHPVPHPRSHPREFISLIGSINGLVCIALELEDFIFWNPCLRKFRKVPRLKLGKNKSEYDLRYGFGYDAVADDYKLVAVWIENEDESDVYENEIRIYSGKNNIWKMVKGRFKAGVNFNNDGIFFNGKLHWPTRPGSSGTYKWSIVSIDVGDESCGELDPPNLGETSYDYELGVLEECVCVIRNDKKSHFEFWVMKEYGVRESWTKFASFSCFNEPQMGSYHKPPSVLLNNGKMLVFDDDTLVLYNLQEDSRTVIEINGFRGKCLDCLVYAESLVLP